MLATRTRTTGVAALAVAAALAAAAGPAEAAVQQQHAARPQARAQLGPIAIAVVTVGARIGAKFGPKIVKVIRGGGRAARRGRSGVRKITRWGRRYARRGRRAAFRAWVAFRRLPKWVQGCGMSAVKARLEGSRDRGDGRGMHQGDPARRGRQGPDHGARGVHVEAVDRAGIRLRAWRPG
jgi:hypothetical protein